MCVIKMHLLTHTLNKMELGNTNSPICTRSTPRFSADHILYFLAAPLIIMIS